LLPIIGYWLDRSLIGFVVIKIIRFFNEQHHPADTASNAHPAAMLCVGSKHFGHPVSLKCELFFLSLQYEYKA
jgi:hypothetical protein